MEMAASRIEHQAIRGLKRAEYDRLVAAGAFGDERVELVFGQVVAMSPIDPAHTESVRRVMKTLSARVGERANVYCQSPYAASEDSEPAPDVYVAPAGSYWHDHPSRAYLVIEVARSSLAYDRDEKALLYALSEVDEYWVVDHVHGLVEVRRDRHEGTWRTITTHGRAETIAMLAFPDVAIPVGEILPPA